VLTFHVAGVEGNTAAGAGADDTPAGAHDLGDVSDGRLVRAAGTIGDDPTDPVPFNPSDVDLYHFRVSGPGRYAVAAEVFAQRIGSPLAAAVSLFVLDPATGRLRLLAGNNGTQNPIQSSDHRSLPLFADPALFAGLTAGDYYVAVSSHKNVPDPNRGLLPGTNGIFDPNVSHSGSAGRSRGEYVLDLRTWSDNVPPRVIAVTPGAGSTLDAPPTGLTVTFDKPINLQGLAFATYQGTQQGSLTAVYVRGPSGVLYYPRLQSYDPSTGQATFLMLDRLPPGQYALHLSGPLGLTDFAGNPLVGNDPGGDYVAQFAVGGTGVAPHAGLGPQELGVLFPHQLQGPGFTITPDATNAYHFQVLQAQNYFFLLGGASRPPGVRLTLTDESGAEVVTKAQPDGVSLQAFLKPGAYVVRVSGWDPTGGAYSLRVVLGGSSENPQPLTLGPAPVLRLRLAPAPPDGSATAPPVAVPAGGVQPATPPAVATTAPRGSVEAPSGLLATLGTGPVGGVGSATGGISTGAALLSLAGPDGVAPPAPVRPTSEGGGKPSGGAPAARVTLAGSQDAAAPASGNRGPIQAAVAAALRLIDLPLLWENFFNEPGAPRYEDDDAGRPEEIRPREEDARAADAEAARAAQPEPAAAGLATLAAAASALAGEWRQQTPIKRPRRKGAGAPAP
jgi:hypothetical protein